MHSSAPKDTIDFEDINKDKNAYLRYAQTKMANILHVMELNQRLAGKKVYCNAIHPGFVPTEATLHTSGFVGALISVAVKVLGRTPEDGALTSLYAATSPEVEQLDIRSKYLIDGGKIGSPR